MSQVDARTYADSHTYTRIALQTKLSTSNPDRNKVVLNLNVTNNEYLTVFIEFVTIAYGKNKEFRIDWGDGTFDTFITTSASANETVNKSHTYASTGRYAVQLTTVNYAPAALTKPIYGGPDATDEVNQIYKDYLIDY
jgi:PKD repeat protein